MASSSLMASQALILRNPSFLSPRNPTSLSPPKSSIPRTLSLLSPPKPAFSLFLRSPNPFSRLTPSKSKVFASSSPFATSSPNPNHSSLDGSARIITTLLAISLSLYRHLLSQISLLSLQLKAILPNPNPEHLAVSIRDWFLEALRDRPTAYLDAPLTVVVSGLAKWLDIFSGVLMIRVLLSWFPNLPWDRQPLSAVRDLCDPYLCIFRSIMPPVSKTLDVSPILAFLVLGLVGQILKSGKGGF